MVIEHVSEDCQCEGRKCRKCEQIKCVGMYRTRRERGYVYLRTDCDICRRTRDRNRWHKNAEEINTKRRAQRPLKADKLNAQTRASYAIHGAKYNERKRTRYASDKDYAEHVKKLQRQSIRKNKENIHLRNQSYRQKNGDRLRERDRQRYREDESRRQVSRTFRKRYPDLMKTRDGVYTHKRRARKKSAPGTYTPAQIAEQLKRQKYRCYYLRCGQAKFPRDKRSAYGYRFHIEHSVPLSRTECDPRNDLSNIVLSCEQCNLEKHNKLPHEWFEGGRLF